MPTKTERFFTTSSIFVVASIFFANILIYQSLGIEKKKKIMETICNKCNGNYITDETVKHNEHYCKILCSNCYCGTVLVIT